MKQNNFCASVSLPNLSKETEFTILDFVRLNTRKFHSFGILKNVMYSFMIQQPLKGVNYFMPSIEDDKVFLYNLLKENNIILKIPTTSIHIQHIKISALPHRDPKINLKLIYNIKGKAITNFYREKKEFLSHINLKKNMLDLQFSIEMELNQWYLINVGEIHDVELIEDSDRIAIVIDVSESFSNFSDAVKNYKNIFYGN